MREVTVVMKCDKCKQRFDEDALNLDVTLKFFGTTVLNDLCDDCVDVINNQLNDLFENGHHKLTTPTAKGSGKGKAGKVPANSKCSWCGYESSARGVSMHIAKSDHPDATVALLVGVPTE